MDLSTPIVMGILNLTPDSFFDGGHYRTEPEALQQVEKMLNDGASIIDVGGMSSRPGAELINEEEELRRIVPLIAAISKQFPKALISIDTIRAKVAKEAIAAGATIVNDISAGTLDHELLPTVARLKTPYILMHMQGQPKNMQENPQYSSITQDLIAFFQTKLQEIYSLGIKDVILDPGFGFGKTISNNYTLLRELNQFKLLGLPILVGLSRKSMIWKLLEISPEEALNSTTALHMTALMSGAKILRVHDVKEAVQAIRLYQALENAP